VTSAEKKPVQSEQNNTRTTLFSRYFADFGHVAAEQEATLCYHSGLEHCGGALLSTPTQRSLSLILVIAVQIFKYFLY